MISSYFLIDKHSGGGNKNPGPVGPPSSYPRSLNQDLSGGGPGGGVGGDKDLGGVGGRGEVINIMHDQQDHNGNHLWFNRRFILTFF